MADLKTCFRVRSQLNKLGYMYYCFSSWRVLHVTLDSAGIYSPENEMDIACFCPC